MYKHRIYMGSYLKIYLGVSVSILTVKVPARRIVTMSGTEFVYGYNSEQLFPLGQMLPFEFLKVGLRTQLL